MTLKNLFTNAVCALTLATFVGCSKEEATAPTAPEPTPSAPTQTELQRTAAPAVQANAPSDPRLQESQAAIKAREYDRAAEALIALRRARLTDQQAAIAAAQMQQLQSDLASAVASGDPRAKAAADRLRQSAGR